MVVALLSLWLCWQLAQGSSWKDGSRNSPPCRASNFSVCAGTEGVGLWDFSSHHFCLVKQVIAQINPNTKSSHPALRHQAGGGCFMGEVYQTSLLFIWLFFHNLGSGPCSCLGKVQGCASQDGAAVLGHGMPTYLPRAGDHAHGAKGGTTIAALPLHTALRTRVA